MQNRTFGKRPVLTQGGEETVQFNLTDFMAFVLDAWLTLTRRFPYDFAW